MATCIISPTGTIILPKDVLSELSAQPGDSLVLEFESDHIKITPGQEILQRLQVMINHMNQRECKDAPTWIQQF